MSGIREKSPKRRKGGPIIVEMTLACGLRILVGRKQNDITHIFGISRTDVHLTFCWFLLSVNEATELNIVLPKTYKEWDQVRMEFKKKS